MGIQGEMYTKNVIWLHQIFCLIALMYYIADKAFRKTSTNPEHQGLVMIKMKLSRTIKRCRHHWINTQLQMIFHTKLKMVLKQKKKRHTIWVSDWVIAVIPQVSNVSVVSWRKKLLFDDMMSACKRSTRLFRFL